MANIAIDVDNTLYSFDLECREAFFEMALDKENKDYLRGAYAPQVEWRSLGDVLGFPALAEAIEIVHSRTLEQTPYKGAVKTVQQIAEKGHKIKYVTTRDEKHAEITEGWLAKYHFPEAPVYCSNEDKTEFISDCQYIIDDRPKTILNFIYDYDWKSEWQREDNQRKAFGLWFPYNQNLTDVRNVLLAPTWRGINYYLERKGIL